LLRSYPAWQSRRWSGRVAGISNHFGAVPLQDRGAGTVIVPLAQRSGRRPGSSLTVCCHVVVSPERQRPGIDVVVQYSVVPERIKCAGAASQGGESVAADVIGPIRWRTSHIAACIQRGGPGVAEPQRLEMSWCCSAPHCTSSCPDVMVPLSPGAGAEGQVPLSIRVPPYRRFRRVGLTFRFRP